MSPRARRISPKRPAITNRRERQSLYQKRALSVIAHFVTMFVFLPPNVAPLEELKIVDLHRMCRTKRPIERGELNGIFEAITRSAMKRPLSVVVSLASFSLRTPCASHSTRISNVKESCIVPISSDDRSRPPTNVLDKRRVTNRISFAVRAKKRHWRKLPDDKRRTNLGSLTTFRACLSSAIEDRLEELAR